MTDQPENNEPEIRAVLFTKSQFDLLLKYVLIPLVTLLTGYFTGRQTAPQAQFDPSKFHAYGIDANMRRVELPYIPPRTRAPVAPAPAQPTVPNDLPPLPGA